MTVTPNDGTANGPGATDSATVGNAAPVVDSVVIDQATPRTNDTLSATVTASDPDGGSPTPSYQWTRNGTDIVGATNATLNLATAGNGDKGDLIRVRVTVSDGSVDVRPADVVAGDHPEHGAHGDRVAERRRARHERHADRDRHQGGRDGDTVTLTYLWTVNGITRQTTTTTSLTDTFDLSLAGNGDPGDTIVTSR